MKKFALIICGFFIVIISLPRCSASKKAKAAAVPEPPKMSFSSDLKAVIEGNCSPCHIPSKGGNKKAYDIYANVKTDIDEMIRRIELTPGDKGFMPFKKKEKLGDSTIALFKQWKNDGLLEN